MRPAHTVLDADLATIAPMGSSEHRGDDRGDDAEPGGRKVGLRGRPEPGRLPVDDLALDRQAVEADPMGDPPAEPTPESKGADIAGKGRRRRGVDAPESARRDEHSVDTPQRDGADRKISRRP